MEIGENGMKAVVIYKSKTGYTKKYAEWIAEAVNADIFENSQIDMKGLNSYDMIIYGGSLFATGILGIKRIKKALKTYPEKKVVVFADGLSPVKEDTIQQLMKSNFSEEELKTIRFFYFRGGFNLKRLPLFDQLMMKIMKRSIEWKKKSGKELSSDDIGMLTVFDKVVDYTDKKSIDELVSCIRS